MRKMASRFGSFGVNIVVKTLENSPDSASCLAIGLVMLRGSHVEINLVVGHILLPEAGCESGISIRGNINGETVDREDSVNEDVCSFDNYDVLSNGDEVGETSEAIQ